jgi:hypothetical protein
MTLTHHMILYVLGTSVNSWCLLSPKCPSPPNNWLFELEKGRHELWFSIWNQWGRNAGALTQTTKNVNCQDKHSIPEIWSLNLKYLKTVTNLKGKGKNKFGSTLDFYQNLFLLFSMGIVSKIPLWFTIPWGQWEEKKKSWVFWLISIIRINLCFSGRELGRNNTDN